MKRKLKIGIIGAGNIGGALTRHFTRLGHDVVVANSRGPESLADLAKETGAKPATVAEVPRGRDLMVVTIPEAKIPNLPPGLFKDAPDDLIVIDTGNYYPRQRDGRIEGIEKGLTESRWVEQQLGHPVRKVFNNIYAENLEMERPPGAEGRTPAVEATVPKPRPCDGMVNEWALTVYRALRVLAPSGRTSDCSR